MRVKEELPQSGDKLLDMASGPIQFEEYLTYSQDFNKHYCVDLSGHALQQARMKLGVKGEFIQGSFFNILLPQNSFDAVISLHTIYHMDKDKQQKAVSKLLDLVKPGQKLVIVYHNPDALFQWVERFVRLGERILDKLGLVKMVEKKDDGGLYFHAHKLSWWNQFEGRAKVEQRPWRSMTSYLSKKLVKDNKTGKNFFKRLFQLENKYPKLFLRVAQYNMITLTKNDDYSI